MISYRSKVEIRETIDEADITVSRSNFISNRFSFNIRNCIYTLKRFSQCARVGANSQSLPRTLRAAPEEQSREKAAEQPVPKCTIANQTLLQVLEMTSAECLTAREQSHRSSRKKAPVQIARDRPAQT
jgi:hypothetical protein